MIGRVLEHHLGAGRTAHVARHDLGAVDVDAVGGRHAHAAAGGFHDVRDHADRRGLAVRAGDGDDRHARLRARREEHVDDRATDVARVPLGGVGVHAETGTGIDFDDRAARLADRFRDIRNDEVDAGDVEPDHHGRLAGDLLVVGMNVVGSVDRGAAGAHVAGALEWHDLSLLGDIGEREAVPLQRFHRLTVDRDAGEDLLVTDAAPRIAVRDVDQLLDRVLAIADDMRRNALGHRDDLVVDDQDAVVEPFDEALDHHDAGARFAHRDIGKNSRTSSSSLRLMQTPRP